jgi:hypothetical protein
MGRVTKKMLLKMPGGKSRRSLQEQVTLGAFPRPSYAYTAVRASELAVRLGYKEVTWIEFGVASGNGLIAVEEIKAVVYDFEVFGYERWQEKIMIYHDFGHARYTEYVGDVNREAQIPLAN